MSWFDALVLGVVEGLTEFLPISSTGHLILASNFLGLSGDFVKSFEIVIQLGAILAVVLIFGFSDLGNWQIWKKLILSFLPTGVAGVILYPVVKNYFLDNVSVVLISLFVGGLFLIWYEWGRPKLEQHNTPDLSQITILQALIIGCFQILAFVPGVSRAGATIVGGLILGLPRSTIVKFSFLLAIPTMLSATVWDLWQNGANFSDQQFGLLAIGLLSAGLSAGLAVKWLLNYVSKNNFTSFGVYRVALALAWWLTLT